MAQALDKARWYVNRVISMSPSEILHRIGEMTRRKTAGYLPHRLIPYPRDYGMLPHIPALRENLDAWDVPTELLNIWRTHAADTQSGRFFLLGQLWPECPRDWRWHLDPVSGKFWPYDIYCFNIDYRHAGGWGDVKYVWELNRLQHLQPIAALARKTGHRALAQFCLDEIESWIDNNLPYKGVNWTSGIELALRAVSILIVTTLVGDAMSHQQRAKIWAALETHGLWLARYPSGYSSANNHRTAEGLGLFVLGTLCPHFAAARQWQISGWDMLCETARLQILPDGVGAEQAIAYTAVVLEMLLTGLHIARSANIDIPAYYTHRIAAGGEYLRWFTDAGGNQPRIGDDDNACVIGAYHAGEKHICSILGSIAAITRRADLTPPHVEPQLRQTLFGFPPAPDFSVTGVRHFRHGGYTVGRHPRATGDMLLAFDHGYLGYLSIAAHGHADALALWLHLGGQPVFVDAGTYLYHSGGHWRKRFRGTRAHNTLCLNGADSSLMSGNFNWSRKANVTLRHWSSDVAAWTVEAEHDGFLDEFKTLHRRRLEVKAGENFIITDTLIGPVAGQVEVNFLLHPDLTAAINGNQILVLRNNSVLLELEHKGPLIPGIGLPNTQAGGWYSPTFSEKIPTTRIFFQGTLAPDIPSIIHVDLKI